MTNIKYSDAVHKERLRRGWSRAQLADEALITIADIIAIEAGTSTAHIDAVLHALDVEQVTILLPAEQANWLRSARLTAGRVPDDRLAVVLAACADLLARAAAGEVDRVAARAQLTLLADTLPDSGD